MSKCSVRAQPAKPKQFYRLKERTMKYQYVILSVSVTGVERREVDEA